TNDPNSLCSSSEFIELGYFLSILFLLTFLSKLNLLYSTQNFLTYLVFSKMYASKILYDATHRLICDYRCAIPPEQPFLDTQLAVCSVDVQVNLNYVSQGVQTHCYLILLVIILPSHQSLLKKLIHRL